MMEHEEFARRLAALQANPPPPATSGDLGIGFVAPDHLDEEWWELASQTSALLAGYLSHFTPLVGERGGCPLCGAVQGGLMGLLMGGFEWGIVNGEGRCSQCSYPGRAIHRIDDVGEISNRILMYHPSIVILRPEAE